MSAQDNLISNPFDEDEGLSDVTLSQGNKQIETKSPEPTLVYSENTPSSVPPQEASPSSPQGDYENRLAIPYTSNFVSDVQSRFGLNGKYQVTVTDPEKKGEGMNTFVSYKVNTTFETVHGGIHHASVVRRFSEFDWLQVQLFTKFPGVLIPPIPEKQIVGRFSAELINERRRGLENFLNRIAQHSELHFAEDVIIFLLGDDTQLVAAKVVAKQDKSKDSTAANNFFNFFKSSIDSISNSGKEKLRTTDDLACDQIADYATELGNHLKAIHSDSKNLIDIHRGVATNWFDFGLACTSLGKYAGSCKENVISHAMAYLGSGADHVSVLLNKKADQENTVFREPIKEWVRITEAVKAMVEGRNRVLQNYQRAQATLVSRQQKYGQVRGLYGKEDKAAQLEKSVQESEEEVAERKAELTKVTQKTNVEYEKFQIEKEKELKHVILDYVRLQIEHSKKVQSAWENVLREVEKL